MDMPPNGDPVSDAFRRGHMLAMLEDHERQLRSLDQHIAATAQSLDAIRITLARVMVVVPVVVVMSNALVGLIIFELTR